MITRFGEEDMIKPTLYKLITLQMLIFRQNFAISAPSPTDQVCIGFTPRHWQTAKSQEGRRPMAMHFPNIESN